MPSTLATLSFSSSEINGYESILNQTTNSQVTIMTPKQVLKEKLDISEEILFNSKETYGSSKDEIGVEEEFTITTPTTNNVIQDMCVFTKNGIGILQKTFSNFMKSWMQKMYGNEFFQFRFNKTTNKIEKNINESISHQQSKNDIFKFTEDHRELVLIANEDLTELAKSHNVALNTTSSLNPIMTNFEGERTKLLTDLTSNNSSFSISLDTWYFNTLQHLMSYVINTQKQILEIGAKKTGNDWYKNIITFQNTCFGKEFNFKIDTSFDLGQLKNIEICSFLKKPIILPETQLKLQVDDTYNFCEKAINFLFKNLEELGEYKIFGLKKWMYFDFSSFANSTDMNSNFQINIYDKLDSKMICHIIERKIDNFQYITENIFDSIFNHWKELENEIDKKCNRNEFKANNVSSFVKKNKKAFETIFNSVIDVCNANAIDKGDFTTRSENIFSILQELDVKLISPLQDIFQNFTSQAYNWTIDSDNYCNTKVEAQKIISEKQDVKDSTTNEEFTVATPTTNNVGAITIVLWLTVFPTLVLFISGLLSSKCSKSENKTNTDIEASHNDRNNDASIPLIERPLEIITEEVEEETEDSCEKENEPTVNITEINENDLSTVAVDSKTTQYVL